MANRSIRRNITSPGGLANGRIFWGKEGRRDSQPHTEGVVKEDHCPGRYVSGPMPTTWGNFLMTLLLAHRNGGFLEGDLSRDWVDRKDTLHNFYHGGHIETSQRIVCSVKAMIEQNFSSP